MSNDRRRAYASLQDEGQGKARDDSPYRELGDIYHADGHDSPFSDISDIYDADEPRQVDQKLDTPHDENTARDDGQRPPGNSGEQSTHEYPPSTSNYTTDPHHDDVHHQLQQLRFTTPDRSTVPDDNTESASRPDSREEKARAESPHSANVRADSPTSDSEKANAKELPWWEVDANYAERPSRRMSRTSSRTSSRAPSRFSSPTHDARGSGRAVSLGRPANFARRRNMHAPAACNCCMEDQNRSTLVELPCGHHFCRRCFTQLVTNSIASEALFPPTCCPDRPFNVQRLAGHFLPPTLLDEFWVKKDEFETADRTYCHVPTCSTFLSMKCGHIHAKIGTCPKCGAKTCTACKAQAHEGEECKADPALDKVMGLARERKWQRYYNCKRVVETKGGCNQMDCYCGASFCYYCAQPWTECKCKNPTVKRVRLSPRAFRQAVSVREELQHLGPLPELQNTHRPDETPCEHPGLFYTPEHEMCFRCGRTEEGLECPVCQSVFCEECSETLGLSVNEET